MNKEVDLAIARILNPDADIDEASGIGTFRDEHDSLRWFPINYTEDLNLLMQLCWEHNIYVTPPYNEFVGFEAKRWNTASGTYDTQVENDSPRIALALCLLTVLEAKADV